MKKLGFLLLIIILILFSCNKNPVKENENPYKDYPNPFVKQLNTNKALSKIYIPSYASSNININPT